MNFKAFLTAEFLRKLSVLLCLGVLATPLFVGAAINQQIPFQGTLKTPAGVAVTDGDYDMVFRLYDAASGGTTLWTGNHTAGNGNPVTVADGLFRVLLGSGAGNDISGVNFDSANLYLGITIAGDGEMSPRQRLGAAPYAFNADTVDGLDADAFAQIGNTATFTAATTTNFYTSIFNAVSGIVTNLVTTNATSTNQVVTGDLRLTGSLTDSAASAGTSGYVLQTTGGGVQWVATSSLGLTGGVNPFGADINANELASEDFGDFTCNGVSCSLDTTYLTTVDISADTNLAVTATGLELSDDSIALSAGFTIPRTASTTEWDTAFTWGDHSLAGYLTDITAESFLDLADTPGSFTANRIPFMTGAALTTNAGLVFDGTNLGVGTSSPQAPLHIAGSGSTLLRLEDTTATFRPTIDFYQQGTELARIQGRDTGGGELRFNTNGGTRITVNATGSVGIGTVDPDTTLDVRGDLTVTAGGATPTIVTDVTQDFVTIGSTFSLAPLAVSAQAGTTSALFWGNTNENKIAFANATLSDFASIGINSGGLALSGSPFITDPDLMIDNSGEVGIGDSTPNFHVEIQGTSSLGYFAISTDDLDDGNILIVDNTGNIGIGTTTPTRTLSVNGDLGLTGALYDTTDSAGTNGMVLQTTGTGVQWVATSTLGIVSGSSVTFGTNDQIPFMNAGGTDFEYASSFTFNGTVLSVAGGIAINDSTSANGGLTLNGSTLAVGSSTANNYFFAGATSTTFSSDSNYNVGFGEGALNTLGADADSNLAIGNNALFGSSTALMTGDNNIAIGANALTDNTSGTSNTGLGVNALQNNTAGSRNVVLGQGAAFNNTVGSNNTVLGQAALFNNTDGSHNVALGTLTLFNNNGTGTIAIGRNVANSATAVNQGIIIGYDIEFPSNTADGQLNIGNSIFGTGIDGTGTTISSGNIGIGTSTPASKLDVWGDLQVGTSSTPTLLVDPNTGSVYIGTTGSAPTQSIEGRYTLNSETVVTASSTKRSPHYFTTIGTPTEASDMIAAGLHGNALWNSSSNLISDVNDGHLIGLLGTVTHDSTATVNFGIGAEGRIDIESTGTMTDAYGFYSNMANAGGGSVTNFYGYYMPDMSALSGVSNMFSFYSADPNAILVNNAEAQIGTKLTISTTTAGAIGDGLVLSYANALNGGADISWAVDGTAETAQIRSELTGASNAYLAFSTYDGTLNEAMRIDGNGNIGIGTSTPSSKLDVWGDFQVGTSSTPTLFSDTSTNRVGIGTLTPGASLEVAAGAIIDGTYINSGSGGSNNFAWGNGNTLSSITTGNNNIAVGNSALNSLEDSSTNIAIGNNALNSVVSLGENVAIGNSAGQNVNNRQNVLIGSLVLSTGAGGQRNIVVGSNGAQNFSGSGNIFMGYSVASNLTSGSSNIAIGNNVDLVSTTGSNQLNIGNLLYSSGIGTGSTAGSGGLAIGTSTDSGARLTVQSRGAADILNLLETNGVEVFTVLENGNIGIGTTTPTRTLSVNGDLGLTGALYDTTDSAGTNGMVLQTTGTGVQWVATSTLGISSTQELNDLNDVLTIDADNGIFIGRNAGTSTGSGAANVSLGEDSLNSFTTGLNNTAVGHSALTEIVNGTNNVGIGTDVSSSGNSGRNVLIGSGVGNSSASLVDNVFIGYLVGNGSANNSRNVVIGSSAGNSSLGDDNIFIGYNIEPPVTNGDNQLSIGNIIYGTNVDGNGTTVSTGNIGIGTSTPNARLTVAGDINLDASEAVISYLGNPLITASTTNDSYTFGEGAGGNFTNLTTFNLALGYLAGQNASTSLSINNNYIGRSAGINNSSFYNNFIGDAAGQNNTGASNNIIGRSAGTDNTGSLNNIIGILAGTNNIGSTNNIIGNSAGRSNSGLINNLIGNGAGYQNSGDYNNILGYQTAYNNTGSYSEFIGFETAGVMSASSTVAIGALALRGGGGSIGTNAATTTNNIAIGYRAGYNVLTGGDNNILIGYQAADSLTTGANNLIIGYDIEAPSSTASGQLNVGNIIFGTSIDETGTTISNGNIGIGTSSPVTKLQVFGDIRVGNSGSNGCIEGYDGTLIGGSCTSDEALKDNIVPFETDGEVLENVLELVPVTYTWNEEANDVYARKTSNVNYGLIAQNVEDVFPELVAQNSEGYKQVNFTALPFYLIQALKDMWSVVSGNQDKIEALEARIEALESDLDDTQTSEPAAEEDNDTPNNSSTNGSSNDDESTTGNATTTTSTTTPPVSDNTEEQSDSTSTTTPPVVPEDTEDTTPDTTEEDTDTTTEPTISEEEPTEEPEPDPEPDEETSEPEEEVVEESVGESTDNTSEGSET